MKIIKNIFSEECCDDIFNKINNTIPINENKKKEDWWLWSVWSSSIDNSQNSILIKNEIEEKIKLKLNTDHFNVSWVQMTQYDSNRYLRKHLDGGNNETLIILLSDDFVGGDLLLDDIKIDLNKGDAIFFSGYKIYHEVTKVTSGFRRALIVWYKLKSKTLI